MSEEFKPLIKVCRDGWERGKWDVVHQKTIYAGWHLFRVGSRDKAVKIAKYLARELNLGFKLERR